MEHMVLARGWQLSIDSHVISYAFNLMNIIREVIFFVTNKS